MNSKNTPQSVDEYVASCPKDVQPILEQLRATVREAAPQAEETISYRMPAYKQNGILVYFAAFKDHIGFFPTADGVEAFKNKLSAYKTSKGTLKFPLDRPMPLELVKEIVRYRVKKNSEK